jgi:hypothetical protein
MTKVKTPKETAERWVRGMLDTPPMPCKHCGRRTRGWWGKGKCQYCGGDLPYSEGVALRSKLGLR